MLKIVFCLHRQSHLSEAEFLDYWLNVHGPKVSARADKLGAIRYVQSHTIAGAAGHMAQLRGSPDGFDGIAEVWFDPDAPAPVDLQFARQASRELLEDEGVFIDFARSPIFVTREHVIVSSEAFES